MICALCNEEASLLDSHIMPAFVFRWLKETGGTGHLRYIENPNKRVQDGLKRPLLCFKCEQLFNSFETPFANEVFHPLESEEKARVGYGTWMLKFCVSLSWRVLTHLVRLPDDPMPPEYRDHINAALERWSGFLLGRYPHPDKYEQHFMRFSPITERFHPDLPQNINRYLLRAVDMNIAHGEGLLMTYAKFGSFALFGYVQLPDNAGKWEGTKVHVRHGEAGAKHYTLPTQLLHYFIHRARIIDRISDKMSDRQIEKVDDAVEQNIERFVDSAQLRAMLYDEGLFGEEAIVRRERK